MSNRRKRRKARRARLRAVLIEMERLREEARKAEQERAS